LFRGNATDCIAGDVKGLKIKHMIMKNASKEEMLSTPTVWNVVGVNEHILTMVLQ
jgi:hypothetical protein